MNKQSLLIYNYKVIYDIFDELKDIINFKIRFITHQEILEKKYDPIDLVISKTNLNIENQIILKELPMEMSKLVDYLNINFLRRKINFQKNIKIGKYLINFNSRKMLAKNKYLVLTEKEAKIIRFLNDSKNAVSIRNLQINVWGHKSNLETHTVETHVYRLRKKIEKSFYDTNFIKSSNKGYRIN